ncbi:MAG: methylmalonyl-CoA mutase family protein, partial [Gammaproteobacteria bacterium]
SAVRKLQLSRLSSIKENRDSKQVLEALEALTDAARHDENLIPLAIKAARARATVGEISQALELVFGRHRPNTQSVSGAYSKAYEGNEEFMNIREQVNDFAKSEGRQPRMLVCKLGQDGHDRGSKVIATSFADIGFDVDIGPLFQTPEEVVRDAIENDVHVI